MIFFTLLLIVVPLLAQVQNGTTFMPSNTTTTFMPSNTTTTFMPSNNTTTYMQSNTTTTYMPSNTTTFMPSNTTTTYMPSNTTTTYMPSNATTTYMPSNTTTTYMPSNNTTTYMPSNTTATYMPSNTTTTFMPSNTTTFMPSNTTTFMPYNTTTSIPEPEVCTGHVCLPSENGFFAEGCCDNTYCQCYNGNGYLKHCDGDGVFNEELQACDWDWHVPCCNTSMPTLPTPEEKCKATDCLVDGYFPEGLCDDIFCQCIGGAGHVQHCHDGLFFNPATSVCDWPWNNPGCIATTATTPDANMTTTTEEITTTGGHMTTTTAALEEQCSYNCTEENGVFGEGCCEETYCQCFGGEGFLHYCPPGSVFNAEIGFCDTPDSLECCNDNQTTTTFLPSTTTTYLPNTTTSTPTNTTSLPSSTPASDSCSYNCSGQSDGHYPEGDCLPTYCDCQDGEGTMQNCQWGTVFNQVLGYCTNPENTLGC